MSNPGTTQSAAQPKIGVVEKFALPYYLFLLNFSGFLVIFEYTRNLTLCLSFLFIFPALGGLLPKDNIEVKNSRYHNSSIYHSLPLVVNIVTTWMMFCYFWNHYDEIYQSEQQFQAIIIMAKILASSIDGSHELIHRNELVLRGLGFLSLTLFQFTTYPVLHLYLHHKQVGSPKDPITSPKNQNVYAYAVKAVFATYKFNFQYSKKIFAGCLFLNWSFVGVLFYLAYKQNDSYEFAFQKIGFYLIFVCVSLLLMECIEYIEHYGLVYRSSAEKKPVQEICSWNSVFNVLQNWLIFRFQRHSDHHMNAYKYFTTLELTQKMPQFPFTFSEAFMFSLVPPLWWYLANPYVDQEIEGKKVDQAHLKFTTKFLSAFGLSFLSLLLYISYQSCQTQ